MKQGWEIVSIGSICNIKTGKLDANASSEDGAYPFFTCSKEELRIDNYAYDCECVLIAGNGDLNVKYYNGKFNAYQRTYIISLKDGTNKVLVKYIYKFFEKYIERLRQVSVGGVIKYIKLGDLTTAQLPVPPIAEQEKIVAELDCLSGIIEKKKQQLKELDALAQSIFYEMFGDPIENDKGWNVKKLGDVAKTIFAGGDKPNDISLLKTDEYRYPIYANGDGDRGLLGYSKTYRVEDRAVTIGARGASIGNCRICEGQFTPVVRLITIVPKKELDIIYLYYCACMMEFNINGAGQAQLTTPNVINKDIYLPPTDLQQEFASKIESIEKQKELIAQSIKETETLFNSRMDYYFN